MSDFNRGMILGWLLGITGFLLGVLSHQWGLHL